MSEALEDYEAIEPRAPADPWARIRTPIGKSDEAWREPLLAVIRAAAAEAQAPIDATDEALLLLRAASHLLLDTVAGHEDYRLYELAHYVTAAVEVYFTTGYTPTMPRDRDMAQHEKALLASQRSISVPLRTQVYSRDGWRCRYCGDAPSQLCVDHVLPFSRGGTTTIENLATSCMPCNQRKGARTPFEARMLRR